MGRRKPSQEQVTAPTELGLSRTSRRLLGLLRRQIWAKSDRWAWLNLQRVATTLRVSVRSINRAKLVLEDRGLALFRTITNASGRGHRVVTADPDALDLETPGDEVYKRTRTGKERHFWTRSRRHRLGTPLQVAVQPSTCTSRGRPSDILPPPIIGAAKAARKADPEPDEDDATSSGLAPPPPVTTRWNSLPPPRRVYPPHLNRMEPLTKRQKRLAHALKREFLSFFYDNIKVQQPSESELGSLYNLASRWLARGCNQTIIIQAFEASLMYRHRLATDLQLLRGSRYPLPFSVASTITATDRLLWTRLNSSLISDSSRPNLSSSCFNT